MTMCNCNQGRLPCTCKPAPSVAGMDDHFRESTEMVAGMDGWRWVPVDPLIGMMSHNDHDTRIAAERQLLATLSAAPVPPVPAQCSSRDDQRTPSELSLAGCRCVRFGEGNPHWPCKIHPTPQPPAQVDEREDWGVFAGYLLDKCEGEVISEEMLQYWASEMIADPHYGALFRREKTGAEVSVISLAIELAEEEHGSLRAAAKALGIDPGYLYRLKSGEKINPSDEVLAALGLERVTTYRATWQRTQASPAPSADGGKVESDEVRRLRPVLAMILNALDRDAAEGKTARGEMAAELRAALSALSAQQEGSDV